MMNKSSKNNNSINEITKKLNETLMRSLERLDDNTNMSKNGFAEIERSNAISKTSQAVVNVIKTNIRIMEIANKQNKNINEIKNELDK